MILYRRKVVTSEAVDTLTHGQTPLDTIPPSPAYDWHNHTEHQHTIIYSVSQKSSTQNILRFFFTCGEPVQLKIILVIVQTYSYVYTNFGPFISIFV